MHAGMYNSFRKKLTNRIHNMLLLLRSKERERSDEGSLCTFDVALLNAASRVPKHVSAINNLIEKGARGSKGLTAHMSMHQ